MNKKILPAMLVIIFVSGITLANTYAFFTAQRTASTNTFTTGTLDLNVSADGETNKPFVVENLGISSNIAGSKSWTVKNSGTLPGKLLIKIQNLINSENGCNDQEKTAEPNCETDTNGELGKVVNLSFLVDNINAISSNLSTEDQSLFGSKWDALPAVVLKPNETKTITINWEAKGENYGNEVQSDSLNFDVNFGLVQISN